MAYFIDWEVLRYLSKNLRRILFAYYRVISRVDRIINIIIVITVADPMFIDGEKTYNFHAEFNRVYHSRKSQISPQRCGKSSQEGLKLYWVLATFMVPPKKNTKTSVHYFQPSRCCSTNPSNCCSMNRKMCRRRKKKRCLTLNLPEAY